MFFVFVDLLLEKAIEGGPVIDDSKEMLMRHWVNSQIVHLLKIWNNVAKEWIGNEEKCHR